MFEPNVTTLADFADYVEANRAKPCPGAVAWLRRHDWTNVDEAPFEYAYTLAAEFLPVLGPIFRAGTIEHLGANPFWACHAWLSIPDLTPDEYHFLFARSVYRYPKFAAQVLNGDLTPGCRAIFRTAAGSGPPR